MASPPATPTTSTPPSINGSGFSNEVAAAVPNGQPPLPPGSKATVAIELMREITRNFLGLFTVVAAYVMLFLFVWMMDSTAREKIILLVVGNIITLATGTMTWYFGGAMRSALAALQERMKGAGGGPS